MCGARCCRQSVFFYESLQAIRGRRQFVKTQGHLALKRRRLRQLGKSSEGILPLHHVDGRPRSLDLVQILRYLYGNWFCQKESIVRSAAHANPFSNLWHMYTFSANEI